MLDWTDRHCRYFLRLLSRHTLLYTEMVTTGAIIHGKGDYLAYSEEEHPVALQLGGSDPCAPRSARSWPRRAAMMRSTSTSAAPPTACRTDVWRLPDGQCAAGGRLYQGDARCGVDSGHGKTRIGIDDRDSYEFLCDFIETVSGKGECEMFIIHARKAGSPG